MQATEKPLVHSVLTRWALDWVESLFLSLPIKYLLLTPEMHTVAHLLLTRPSLTLVLCIQMQMHKEFKDKERC